MIGFLGFAPIELSLLKLPAAGGIAGDVDSCENVRISGLAGRSG